MSSHNFDSDTNEQSLTPKKAHILARKPVRLLASIAAGLFVALVVLNLVSAVVELASLPEWLLRVVAIFGGPIFVIGSAFVVYRLIGRWLGRPQSG